MVGFTGATATDTTAGGAGLTVTGTVAETVGAKTLVAVMLAVPTATPLIVPEVLTETIDGSDDVQVTAVDAPPTAVTVAVSGRVCPTFTAGAEGVMATAVTAGGGFTVTVVFPLFVPSKVEVAVMVALPTATPCTNPDVETVAIAGFELPHVTDVGAPLTAVTFALSWVVAPTATVAGDGETDTADTRGVLSGPGPPDSPPPQAPMMARRATA